MKDAFLNSWTRNRTPGEYCGSRREYQYLFYSIATRTTKKIKKSPHIHNTKKDWHEM
jgi:hypothetical protein